MFSTSLFPLPPPSTSLLPTLLQPATEPTYVQQPHHPQSRRKPVGRLNTPLTTLSHDERLITARKLAIAMYGYSWLKPAGCSKTMLGRREEELEREEVERQLREVELQERMAMEQEEQERREDLRRQAEDGEVEGVEERDLDEDVPEAEEGSDGGEEGDDIEEEDEDMDGDLDNDIPDADGQESSWVYDTRRESDSDSGGEDSHPPTNRQPRRHLHVSQQYTPPEADDLAAQEAMVNAMLDEDELGEYEHQHDLDEDIPDPDDDIDMDMDMDANLSDAVPEADEEPGWEHTDSELEESEMDISLLPPHPNSSSRNPGTTHEEMRRVSGNRMLHPMLPPTSRSRWPRRESREQQEQQLLLQQEQTRQGQPRTAPRRNLRATMQTPGTADDISALISTGGTSNPATGPLASTGEDTIDPPSPTRRNWLNAAGARRNLFGGFRTGSSTTTSTTSASTATGPESRQQPHTSQTTTSTLATRTTGQGISSGGLFTPSPRQATVAGGDDDEQPGEESVEGTQKSD